MVWFKVDDQFHRGKKVRRLGAEKLPAVGLWTLCGDWSADELTDGFVPWDVIESWDPQRTYAKRLIDVTLWSEVTVDDETGIQFHDWPNYQPMRAAVLAERSGNARRTALHRDVYLIRSVRERDGNRCRYCDAAIRWTDRRSAAGGTYNYVDPNGPNSLANVVVSCRGCANAKGDRTADELGMDLLPPAGIVRTSSVLDTDQVRTENVSNRYGVPEPEPEQIGGGTETLPGGRPPRTKRASTQAEPKRRGTRLPADFAVTPDMVEWARANAPRVNGKVETEQFCDYWWSKPGKQGEHLDWVATWRRWMRKAEADIRQPTRPGGRPGTDDKIRQLQAMKGPEHIAIESGYSDE